LSLSMYSLSIKLSILFLMSAVVAENLEIDRERERERESE
jgi:hypothetical protein